MQLEASSLNIVINENEESIVSKAANRMQNRLDRNNIVVHAVPVEVKSGMNLGLKTKHDKAIFMELSIEIEVEYYIQ